MFGLGGGELLFIFFLALIFIGPKKLPELAKSLGKSIREFQKAKDEFMSGVRSDDTDDEEKSKKEISDSEKDKSQEENSSKS